ncbi:hypothetical protein MA05_02945 [Comamonas aquatica]|nr:hypothetical protein MA05_02945 [Comamonas aquatica]
MGSGFQYQRKESSFSRSRVWVCTRSWNRSPQQARAEFRLLCRSTQGAVALSGCAGRNTLQPCGIHRSAMQMRPSAGQ